MTGFAASRGHEKVLIEVTAGGVVSTDHVGLSDAISCDEAQADLVERAADYGLQLHEEERQDHRDPRGQPRGARGPLAQRLPGRADR